MQASVPHLNQLKRSIVSPEIYFSQQPKPDCIQRGESLFKVSLINYCLEAYSKRTVSLIKTPRESLELIH